MTEKTKGIIPVHFYGYAASMDEFSAIAEEKSLCVGDNEPYQVGDEHDYSAPVHGEGRELPHVVVEIRQDHILEAEAQRGWAERLARVVDGARKTL